jgi:hypothetical protein
MFPSAATRTNRIRSSGVVLIGMHLGRRLRAHHRLQQAGPE